MDKGQESKTIWRVNTEIFPVLDVFVPNSPGGMTSGALLSAAGG
jgi:hypothetical protein